MRKNLFSRAFGLLCTLLLAVAAVGCGDDSTETPNQPPEPEPKPEPAVALELMAADHASATFSITPTDADWCSIVVYDAKPATAPTAEEIHAADNRVDYPADKVSMHSMVDLLPQSSYHVYAAVGASNKDGDKFYATATLEINTEKKPATQLLYQSSNSLWYDGVGYDESDNYYFGLCESGIMRYEDKFVPDTYGAYLLFFDIYGASTADEENPILPDGTYRLGEEKTMGTLYNVYSGAVDFNGDAYRFSEGEVTVSREGSTYTINVRATLSNGKQIEDYYVGELTFAIGSVAPKVPKIEHDMTTTFTGVSAAFIKPEMASSGQEQINISFYDTPRGEHGEQVGGYNLSCEVIMKDINRYNIDFPSRQYDVSLSYQPYTIIVGDVIGLSESGIHQLGTTVRHIDPVTGDTRYAAIVAGHMTISSSDNNETYTVDIDMTTAEGYTIKGSYNGPIPVYGELPPKADTESPLTGDKVIELGSSPKLTAKYRPYSEVFLIEGKGTGADGEHVDGFRIEIFASDDMDKESIPCGTFLPGETAGTFKLGSVDRTDGISISGTFGYIDYLVEAFFNILTFESQAFAPTTDGKVVITDNGDGTHTVEYELYDDAGPANKITCNVTGTFEFE